MVNQTTPKLLGKGEVKINASEFEENLLSKIEEIGTPKVQLEDLFPLNS